MSLIDASALSQIIGAVAVIASLIFVGIQVWQGNRMARAQMTAAVGDTMTSLMQTASSARGLAAAYAAIIVQDRPAEVEDFTKLMFWFNGWLHVYYGAWIGYRDRMIDPGIVELIELNILSWMTKPAMGQAWTDARHGFPDDFIAHVEARRGQFNARMSGALPPASVR